MGPFWGSCCVNGGGLTGGVLVGTLRAVDGGGKEKGRAPVFGAPALVARTMSWGVYQLRTLSLFLPASALPSSRFGRLKSIAPSGPKDHTMTDWRDAKSWRELGWSVAGKC